MGGFVAALEPDRGVGGKAGFVHGDFVVSADGPVRFGRCAAGGGGDGGRL